MVDGLERLDAARDIADWLQVVGELEEQACRSAGFSTSGQRYSRAGRTGGRGRLRQSMIARSGPRRGRYRAHPVWPLSPDHAARAIKLYTGSRRMGLLGIAGKLGVNPLRVLDALEKAGVAFRSARTWNPVDQKWLYHKTPSPAVAAELAAWRRYRAYVEVMTDRQRLRFSRASHAWWRPDAKARHLAALWSDARARRPKRIKPKLRPRNVRHLCMCAACGNQ